MEVWLRIFGIGLSLIGTILLAWRAKTILDALRDAHYIAEANFRVIKDYMDKQPQTIPFTIGSNVFIDSVKPLSNFLLFFGFFLLFAGNFLVGLSWYLQQ